MMPLLLEIGGVVADQILMSHHRNVPQTVLDPAQIQNRFGILRSPLRVLGVAYTPLYDRWRGGRELKPFAYPIGFVSFS